VTDEKQDVVPEGVEFGPVPDKTDDLEKYTSDLEAMLSDTDGIGEAGGIVFGDLWGVAKDKNGVPHKVKWVLTSRAKTTIGALQGMAKGVGHAQKVFHMNPWMPEPEDAPKPSAHPMPKIPEQQPAFQGAQESSDSRGPVPVKAPVPASAKRGGEPERTDSGDGEVTVTIKTIEHATWQGNEYINVKGGKWSKYGVSAYEELVDEIPEFEGWRDWKVGVPFQPIAGLEKAVFEVVGDKAKRVLRFLPA
jgi:hypothetical protein